MVKRRRRRRNEAKQSKAKQSIHRFPTPPTHRNSTISKHNPLTVGEPAAPNPKEINWPDSKQILTIEQIHPPIKAIQTHAKQSMPNHRQSENERPQLSDSSLRDRQANILPLTVGLPSTARILSVEARSSHSHTTYLVTAATAAAVRRRTNRSG